MVIHSKVRIEKLLNEFYAIDKLPFFAQIALLARTLRRSWPLFTAIPCPDDNIYTEGLTDYKNAIELIEAISTSGVLPPEEKILKVASNIGYISDEFWGPWSTSAAAAADAVYALGSGRKVIWGLAYSCIYNTVQAAIDVFFEEHRRKNGSEMSNPEFAFSHGEEMARTIKLDLELLLDTSMTQQWTDTTLIHPDFFLLRTVFDQDLTHGIRSVIEIPDIKFQKLVRTLKADPTRFQYISPTNFEELVGRLLEEMGFTIEFTAKTRDGGYDICAINSNPFVGKYLIECKHYKPHNHIGVSIVRQLHGVIQSENATKGVLVTTSTFTQPAQEYIAKNKWSLEGVDLKHLLNWLWEYDTNKMRYLFTRGMS